MAILGLSALCMVSVADTVGFTVGEGYTIPAQLTTYPDWNGNALFMVNTNGTGTVEPSATSQNIVMNNMNGVASSATTVETSIQFRFTVANAAYSGGAKPLIGVQLETGTTQTGLVSDDVRAMIQRTAVTSYQLVLNDLTGPLQQFKPLSFNDDLISIFAGGDTSDLLELKLVLNRGVDEMDWTADASLFNIDTGLTVTETIGNAIDTPEAYFNSTLYGGFFNGTSDGSMQVSGRQIESFTVIPEPATLGMIGLVSAGLLIVRRFLSV